MRGAGARGGGSASPPGRKMRYTKFVVSSFSCHSPVVYPSIFPSFGPSVLHSRQSRPLWTQEILSCLRNLFMRTPECTLAIVIEVLTQADPQRRNSHIRGATLRDDRQVL